MSHGAAWRFCYLFCRNHEVFQGHLDYFEESQPVSISSRHKQMKVATLLLGKHPSFPHCSIFVVGLHSVVGFGNLPKKPECHRESYFVKSNHVFHSSTILNNIHVLL